MEKIFEHPKDFHTGNDYKKYFPNTTEELDRFKSNNFFFRHKIESALKVSQFKHGDEIIMATLRDSRAWIRCDKFDTHREASILWLKNMSPSKIKSRNRSPKRDTHISRSGPVCPNSRKN